MKKIFSLGIIILLLTSLLNFVSTSQVSAQSTSETTLFSDDFESYAVGTLPSPPWEFWFNNIGGITDTAFVSPRKSLRLLGSYGWSTEAVRRFSSSARYIGYEVYGRVESTAGPFSLTVGFAKRTGPGTSAFYATVSFNTRTIGEPAITAGGIVLQSFEAKRWYKIRVVFDRESRTYDVWIDDVLKASSIPDSNPDPYNIEGFNLASEWAEVNCYFDDVKVFEVLLTQEYYLRVYFSSAVVNGNTLSASNPTITVSPGSRITGYFEAIVDNNRGGSWITPVIGTASWRRGWSVCISGDAPTGSSRQRFNFDLTAPDTPGTYYIGIFTAWMYTCDEVASHDHPANYGDGDDVWDMPNQGWEEVIANGGASTGPYHMPGRAIRVVVQSHSSSNNFTRSQELSYDDGTADFGFIAWAGAVAAVKFSVSSSVRVLKLRYYIWGDMNPIRVHVLDKNFNSIFSQSVTPKPNWFEVDISSANVVVVGDFFVALEWPSGGQPWLGVDNTAPHHSRSYLGSLGSPGSPKQGEDYMIRVIVAPTDYDVLYVRVMDQSPYSRRIPGAVVVLNRTDVTPSQIQRTTANASGEAVFTVPPGSYTITATSPTALYGKAASLIMVTSSLVIPGTRRVDLLLPIFDVTIKLVSPSGSPIAGADVTVGGIALGKTDANGEAVATSIPSGSFMVTASWYGLDISPATPLVVTGPGTFTMTASKIARIKVQVVGAMNQGLGGASVTVKTGTSTVYSGTANNEGVVTLDLPYGTYEVKASYKGTEATKLISVTGDAMEKISTGVFIELLGQPLTLARLLMWTMLVFIIIAILALWMKKGGIKIGKSAKTEPTDAEKELAILEEWLSKLEELYHRGEVEEEAYKRLKEEYENRKRELEKKVGKQE